MDTSLPTLYKRTNTGATQTWQILVDGTELVTRFGQLDGKIQETRDTIKSGKNVGRANETSAEQQACCEALSKWEKQIKKGYVESLEMAQAGENALESVAPMLAQSYDKHSGKIVYPCYIQPKLDGIRCIAIVGPDETTLWSRTRKPIVSVPHINTALSETFRKRYGDSADPIILDGELYSHAYRDNFEEIVSVVRQAKTPSPNHTIVEYHIYDVVDESQKFENRFQTLKSFLNVLDASPYLRKVTTVKCDSEATLTMWYETFLEQGYEGAMARNNAVYECGKRSYHLQKLKTFDDAEFKIIGVKEGRGKLQGHAAAFVCETVDGAVFDVKLKGELANLKGYFERPEEVYGKALTVQFQGYTNAKKVPRFPVGLRFREGGL